MRVTTWQQDQFLTPGRELYRWPGDFYSIDEFIPSTDGQRLNRLDSWGSTHITYPSDFKEPRGAFYDQANDTFVIVGTNTAVTDVVGTFYIAHDNFTASASAYAMSSSASAIGGTHKLNTRYIQNGFWVVGSDGDVYLASDPYGTAASNKYGSGDARAIVPVRDTLYMITTTDEILRWDTSSGAFVSLYDTWLQLGGTFLCHHRNDLVLIGYENDGSVALYRIDEIPPAELRAVTRLEPHTAQRKPDAASAQWSTPWTIYHEDLYFCPGVWISPDSAFQRIPIYRYTDTVVELVDTIDFDPSPYNTAVDTPTAWGLLKWRDRLLLYTLLSGSQTVYLLHNGRFTSIMTSTYTTPSLGDIYSVGGHLLMLNTQSGNDGFSITRRPATTNVFTSSWLDMNHPASQKHLVRLAAIVSDNVADFDVKIEYRTESGSWTEATTQDNARHVDVGDLGIDFYLLQIRITFTDGTGNYEDVTLESIAATFSYGVP